MLTASKKEIVAVSLGVLVAMAIVLASKAVLAQAGGIHIELNKLQQVQGACRAYLVTQNLTQTRFESIKLDVVMFNNNGIVSKRLAVQIAPLPKSKTSLKVFDIQGLPCNKIGQLLLNDVLECKDDKVAREDCLSLISVSSRSSVGFIE